MEINNFLQISIVGVALSGVIQYLKIKYGVSGAKTKALTLVLAVVVGTVFVLIKDTAYFQTIITILGVASAIYAFLVK